MPPDNTSVSRVASSEDAPLRPTIPLKLMNTANSEGNNSLSMNKRSSNIQSESTPAEQKANSKSPDRHSNSSLDFQQLFQKTKDGFQKAKKFIMKDSENEETQE